MTILSESKYLFFAAIFFGLFFPDLASNLEFILIPALIIMMSVSIKDIAFRHINKQDVEEITGFTLLNYFILGSLYVGFSFFLDSPYREAIMMLGIMPPSVGIITLSKILKGNTRISFLTELVSYVVAIGFIPLASKILFSQSFSILKVLEIVGLIIIIPFIISRIIHNYELKHPKKHTHTKTIVNICYALTFYMIIGINREYLFQFADFWQIYLILIILKFGFGSIIYYIFKSKLKKEDTVLIVLFSTFKNASAAIAFTLMLFGTAATIPFAINGITTPLYILYLEWLLKK